SSCPPLAPADEQCGSGNRERPGKTGHVREQHRGGNMQADEPFRRLETIARAWVEARQGAWDHAAWLSFLEEARRATGLPLEPATVGRILERCKSEYWNLRRWRESGGAYAWVEARRGAWSHHEWMCLLAGLQCWLGPLDPTALARALDEAREQFRNLQR